MKSGCTKTRSFLAMMSDQCEASANARADEDFFPTPPEASHAFMRAEHAFLKRFYDDIWEPACGDGAISKVVSEYGFIVRSSDLIDRHYSEGRAGIDFLKTETPWAPAIITNPPYKNDLPELFVRHAYKIGVCYIAMLLKSQFFNAGCRASFWRDMKPARVYHLGFRCDFLGLGRPTMDCDWWVWDFSQDPVSSCIDMGVLERPDDLTSLNLFSGEAT